MSEPRTVAKFINDAVNSQRARTPTDSGNTSRRVFLNRPAGATALVASSNAIELGPLAEAAGADERLRDAGERVRESFEIRERAAREKPEIPTPQELMSDKSNEKKYKRRFVTSDY